VNNKYRCDGFILVDVLSGLTVLGLGAGAIWMSLQHAVSNLESVNARLEQYRAVEHARIWLHHSSRNEKLPLQLTYGLHLKSFEEVERAGYAVSYRLELVDSEGVESSFLTWVTPR
jgi:hypothetical protein